MSREELKHREEVKAAILRALASGHSTADEVLVAVGSPDPSLVRELFNELMPRAFPSTHSGLAPDLRLKATQARRLSAQLPLELPVSDPMRCQWWFTLDSVVDLAEKTWEYAASGHVAFLGVPTVGFHYAHWLETSTTILDADPDVIQSLKLPPHATKECYDVVEPVALSLRRAHAVVLLDPPWYPTLTELFISRARDLAADESFILCVLPSRLTRPGLIEERTRLVDTLLRGNFEIVALESEYVTYRVPEFERRAYGGVDGFSGRHWRKGDLLVLRVGPSSVLAPSENLEREEPLVFARDRRLARFFLDPRRANVSLGHWIVPADEFANSVSARGLDLRAIAAWGTNRRAAFVRDADLVRRILELWAAGKSREGTAADLAEAGTPEAEQCVTELDAVLALWAEPSVAEWRRTPEQLRHFRTIVLSDLASQPTGRMYAYEDDGFRLDFQRDRDRVLWSDALKRLANKTQLFPVTSDDHLRRRLTHSIEVMQLASTIATSFGLDRDLTEAGALAHDVGHTPFGHAGEFALDRILKEVDPRLGGFNHYEHGVDVVRWLESVYRSPAVGGFPGLNFTRETVECILKHTFHRDKEPLGQSSLIESSKHKDFDDSSCHLEGQAVRIADKISYLISDLEDGIRMGALTYEDLMSCRFFERPPIDMAPSQDQSLHDRFISQRRSILKVLMEDILRATDERLTRLASSAQVRGTRAYIIDYSDSIKKDLIEIWQRLQAGRLHTHPAVVAESMRAARIVRDLFLVYAMASKLVAQAFRESHRGLAATPYVAWYEQRVDNYVGVPKRLLARYSYEHTLGSELRSQGDNWLVPTMDLLLAKDYVASLTDTAAIEEHRRHCLELA
jgi:dGTPase